MVAFKKLIRRSLQHLGQLTGLTHLTIQRLEEVQTSVLELAALLQQLQQLRGLKLWATGAWPLLRHQDSREAAAAEHVVLAQAIASLPQLGALSLSLPEFGQAASMQLAAAGSQLTSLKLRACSLQDSTLRFLAAKLTGLQCLFVEYNRDLSDGVLQQVFGSNLRQLTELDMRYCSVSDAGKQFLATLTRLQQLQV
eukprot:gene2191-2509_t